MNVTDKNIVAVLRREYGSDYLDHIGVDPNSVAEQHAPELSDATVLECWRMPATQDQPGPVLTRREAVLEMRRRVITIRANYTLHDPDQGSRSGRMEHDK